jgi:hypothetical protein
MMGDTLEFVLDMAIAMTEYRSMAADAEGRFGNAYRELHRRQNPEPSGGSMKQVRERLEVGLL